MKILYGTDGSRTARGALEQALATFAFPAHTEVEVMAVAPENLGTGAGADAIAEVNIDLARTRLAAAGLHATGAAAVGDPATELIARAEALQPDLVILGADRGGQIGPHPLARSIGRVAASVTLDGHASVYVATGTHAVRRVLIAHDGSAEAEHAASLFQRLPFRAPPDVVVVSVVEPDEGGAGGGTAVMARESTAVAHAIASEAAQLVRLAAASIEVRTPSGVPSEQIEIAARATSADLVIVGTRGLGARQRRRIGSVAETLLARMPASVLVARAEPEPTPR